MFAWGVSHVMFPCTVLEGGSEIKSTYDTETLFSTLNLEFFCWHHERRVFWGVRQRVLVGVFSCHHWRRVDHWADTSCRILPHLFSPRLSFCTIRAFQTCRQCVGSVPQPPQWSNAPVNTPTLNRYTKKWFTLNDRLWACVCVCVFSHIFTIELFQTTTNPPPPSFPSATQSSIWCEWMVMWLSHQE